MTELSVRLDDWSDRLSPILVKEIRQMVRGREFNYAFGLSLIAGLVVAFFGLADSLNLTGTSGARIFYALIVCLAVLGGVVVPLGAFSALRVEKADQTLDLVTQTALTPRRIVVGKLATQAVKLVMLYSGLSPFIAMSFLLGGIDLQTIFVSLAMLFMWSLWACSACLFMSSASNSRVLSGVLLAVGILGVVGMLTRFTYVMAIVFGRPTFGGPGSTAPSAVWWVLAGATAFCLLSTTNFVLLAENRLALAIEDRATALRIGFFVQFLFVVGVIIGPVLAKATGFSATDGLLTLGFMCGIQLATVSVFTVTEDLVLSRRVLRNIRESLRRRPLFAMFRPGGGRGAVWVLAQMTLLLTAGAIIVPGTAMGIFRWLVAICSYILFFTGVPTIIARLALPKRITENQLRVIIFVFFPVLSLVADVLQYTSTPDLIFDAYSAFHVLNPFRTLANWNVVESQGWQWRTFVMGFIGLISYVALILKGRRETRHALNPH